MIKLPRIKEVIPKITADIIKGFNRRLKLIPLFNIANASWIPLQVQRVLATGTTCSDILALR